MWARIKGEGAGRCEGCRLVVMKEEREVGTFRVAIRFLNGI